MVIQYLHVMAWTGEGSPPTEDENGFPVPGSPGESYTAACRYENFRGGSTKSWQNKKNETVLQRGTVFVKKGEILPKKFETVTVTDPDGVVVFEGELLNVYKGQLNATIAV